MIRKEVKERIIAGMDKEDLTTFRLSIEDAERLHWHHDREFEYLGEMYDVVSRTETTDSVILTCWWDRAESEVHRQLDLLMANTAGDHPDRDRCLGQFFDFSKNIVCVQVSALIPDKSGDWNLQETVRMLHDQDAQTPPVPPPDIV